MEQKEPQEQLKLNKIIVDFNLYCDKLRKGIDLRVAFFELSGIARKVVQNLM